MHSADHEEPGAAGFSLLEVLLAVVLLSVGVLSVAAVATAVARHSGRSARETGRSLAARQVLDSVRRAGFPAAEDGSSILTAGGREHRAAWRVTEVSAGLKRVDVRVEGRGPEPGRSFGTRLHRPSEWEAAAPSESAGEAAAAVR